MPDRSLRVVVVAMCKRPRGDVRARTTELALPQPAPLPTPGPVTRRIRSLSASHDAGPMLIVNGLASDMPGMPEPRALGRLSGTLSGGFPALRLPLGELKRSSAERALAATTVATLPAITLPETGRAWNGSVLPPTKQTAQPAQRALGLLIGIVIALTLVALTLAAIIATNMNA